MGVFEEIRFRLGTARRAKGLHGAIEESGQQNERLRRRVGELEAELQSLREPTGNVSAENLVWIMGSPRTGSTWLGLMLSEGEDREMWREPFFGVSIANMRSLANRSYVKHERYMFGDPHKEIWLPAMREVLLRTAEKRFPGLPEGGHLVLKEPNGSVAAPLTMEAFPESRMVFLVRDPRDVVASLLDAARKGSWYGYGEYEASFAEATFEDPDEAFTERLAKNFVASIEGARTAYERHPGPKIALRYEDLRENTLGELRRTSEELSLPHAGESLERSVAAHAWEGLKEDQKGEGKFHRKAKPGGWKEDLTPRRIEIVEEATMNLIREFYTGS